MSRIETKPEGQSNQTEVPFSHGRTGIATGSHTELANGHTIWHIGSEIKLPDGRIVRKVGVNKIRVFKRIPNLDVYDDSIRVEQPKVA